MSKLLSPLNILLIIIVVALSYFGFRELSQKKEGGPQDTETAVVDDVRREDGGVSDSDTGDKIKENVEDSGSEAGGTNEDGRDETGHDDKAVNDRETPSPDIIREAPPKDKKKKEEEEEGDKSGAYKSSKYGYRFEYPPSWPINVHSAEKVSIGHAVPKKGIGMMNFKVSPESDKNEIEEAKQEAGKYPGSIEIEEGAAYVNGMAAEKYTIRNLMTGEEDYYILIPYNNMYYLISYGDESSEFLGHIDDILASFEFIK